jgi:hypothetical protein
MLINPDKKNINKSFSKSGQQAQNQSKSDDTKTHNSTNDTKNNINSNLNSSYHKSFIALSESNYDSNCLTDRSTNNIKEIKVNVITMKRKNNYIINNINHPQNNLNNNNYIKEIQSFYSEEAKIKKIIQIQKWWKTNYKISFIQKVIRGFLLRKHMSNIFSFIKGIFKLIYKIVFNKIHHKNKLRYTIKKDRTKSTDKIIRKNQTNSRFTKKTKPYNNRPLLSESTNSRINSKLNILKKDNQKLKVDLIKKFTTNNPINTIKTNSTYTSINTNNNNNKGKYLNKNKKNYKEKKEKKVKLEKEKEIRNIPSKDKIIADNIFHIYNNIKKYYENYTNNFNNNTYNNIYIPDTNYSTANSFYPKKEKNTIIKNNHYRNNKTKNLTLKKMLTRGSMKNINERTVINRNNINIKNSKTDRNYSYKKDNRDSVLLLLLLKKAFLFWRAFLMKQKILQKMKYIKSVKTPNNTRKTLSIYTTKKKEEVKSNTIITKKINLSNSLMNIKLKKIIPHKIKTNDNPKQNIIFKNYTKKKAHSNSAESNNSTVYSRVPESSLNKSLNMNQEAKIKIINRNKYQTNICNNSVIVVNQYDRSNEKKIKKYSTSNKKKKDINESTDKKNSKFIDINENKKIYLFYAIINLIDIHNKRKKIKNSFNQWKTLTQYIHSFTNNNKIEEKIIFFKSKKPPFKNNFSTNQKMQNNPINISDNTGNFNCQTESGEESRYCQAKENKMLNMQDLQTTNPLDNSICNNLFKSNIKSSNIVYQKKVLLANKKKTRNPSARAINNNNIDEKEERSVNMTLIDNNNNQEFNILNQSTGQRF